ncbi:MAG: hypothetical protein ABW175_18680 [Bradyrhizobium sp.]
MSMPPSQEPSLFHDKHAGEGGPDEAAAVIAEAAEELARLARRHGLEMLDYLLGMTQLEATERLRLRSQRRLS